MDDAVLLRLYRLARESERGEFMTAAMGLLRDSLGFASAFWGEGRVQPGRAAAVLESAHFYDTDPRFVAAWQALDFAGRLVPVAVNDPGRSLEVRTADFYASQPERAALYEKYRMRSYSFTSDFSSDGTRCRWLNLYRSDADASGARDDLAWIEAVMPHLGEACRIHGAIHPSLDACPDTGGECVAVADRQSGVLLSRGDAFPAAIARGWTAFDGSRLPSPLRAAWAEKASFTVDGRTVRVTGANTGDIVVMAATSGRPERPITARQREIAALYAAGLSHKEVAGELRLSPATVRNHLATVYQSLDVHSRRQLASALAAFGD